MKILENFSRLALVVFLSVLFLCFGSSIIEVCANWKMHETRENFLITLDSENIVQIDYWGNCGMDFVELTDSLAIDRIVALLNGEYTPCERFDKSGSSGGGEYIDLFGSDGERIVRYLFRYSPFDNGPCIQSGDFLYKKIGSPQDIQNLLDICLEMAE